MSNSILVIVESPTKAKTIRKFLPSNYIVEASMGHVRDLPQSAADIPAKYKEEAWAKIGVNVDQNFEPLYIIPKDKAKIIAELKEKLKKCSALYLATDEDREGESISWHLTEILKPKVPVQRMVFHEITKSAIEAALKKTRQVDEKLVRAQETRRILDRLVGYTLSPILWKKIAYGLSAGRVQSVALRVMVERERERMSFVKSIYWDLLADVSTDTNVPFKCRLIQVGTKRVAIGKDFDEKTGQLLAGKDVLVLGETEAKALADNLKKSSWKVTAAEEKSMQSKPPIPFITSTLQQDGNRKLGLSTREVMRTAQSLYEHGLITYMRTDSPNLSQEAIIGVRAKIEELYGKKFLSDEPRQFHAKQKGAQEAHEAIRPAGPDFAAPEKTGLGGAELSLYSLIWKRTLACQMAEAQKSLMSLKITANDTIFSATGTKIVFPGYLKVYQGSDSDQDENILPPVKVGDSLKAEKIEPLSHETKPPARFTEASLVQAMEKAGIGRPSTYASVISTLIDRGYVTRAQTALTPGFTGFAVTQLLEKHFSHLVDLDFTSKMEESLDNIADGELDYLKYLREFFLGKDGLQLLSQQKEKDIDPKSSRAVILPQLNSDIEIRIGRYGPYLVKSDEKENEEQLVYASIPEDVGPADLDNEKSRRILEIKSEGPKPIGTHPKTNLPIYVLFGRYGAYLQLGLTDRDSKEKPMRSSLPKDKDPKSVTLEEALKYLSVPRDLGKNPADSEVVSANNGRFGPYVKAGTNMRSLKKTDDIYEITLERALELLAEEKVGRRGAALIKDLGAHASDKKAVGLYNGKFGLYVKHGKINVSIPKDMTEADVNLENASALLAAKAGMPKSKKTKK